MAATGRQNATLGGRRPHRQVLGDRTGVGRANNARCWPKAVRVTKQSLSVQNDILQSYLSPKPNHPTEVEFCLLVKIHSWQRSITGALSKRVKVSTKTVKITIKIANPKKNQIKNCQWISKILSVNYWQKKTDKIYPLLSVGDFKKKSMQEPSRNPELSWDFLEGLEFYFLWFVLGPL